MDEIKAFKREMQNYNYYSNMLNVLEEKLDELYYELEGVKGIRYDKAPSMPNMKLINEHKHFLSSKIERIENEISRLSTDIYHIENVLAAMNDNDIRQAIIEVYINGKTILEICSDYSLSDAGLHYRMDKEIKNALESVMKIDM